MNADHELPYHELAGYSFPCTVVNAVVNVVSECYVQQLLIFPYCNTIFGLHKYVCVM